MSLDKGQLADAIYVLSDCCAAMAGNIHTLHLNFVGREFDTMHKKVLQDYYDQLDEDYDALAEWARCYGKFAPNKNESAARVGAVSIGAEPVNRDNAVTLVYGFLDTLLKQFNTLFNVMNELSKECPIATGLANYLQTRIEYWAKEAYYFNESREECV
jgi:DNA-binding ferritin-like protein